MQLIRARNVNDAYAQGLYYLVKAGIKSPSRVGEVLVSPVPVTTIYEQPQERVLFDSKRDANPFFHLFESLWMLAGRNDAKWLDRFVGDFSKRYAEADGVMHGAYGWRWRNHFSIPETFDQLQTVINRLRKDPNDRRVVIQMWDPEADLGADKLDVPCNLCVVPRVHDGKLDITVMCRSNDAIWGAYGANAVHFSMLQEYLASKIGVRMGTYYQISNNFHAYTKVMDLVHDNEYHVMEDLYRERVFRTRVYPLVTVPDAFEEDLQLFFTSSDKEIPELPTRELVFTNSFFEVVAVPMMFAHHFAKKKEWASAIQFINGLNIDWRDAGLAWIKRRQRQYESKHALKD